MAETGHVALIIAFILAVISAIVSLVGTHAGSRRLETGARYGILAVACLFTLSVVIILYAFISKDFSLRIVAEHASRNLPGIYSISALYADKAGSMFLWGWLISLFAGILALKKSTRLRIYALFMLAVLETFFLVLVTFVVNVYEKNPSTVADGFGLNPLLQNFGMLVHPPLLYLGFSGFAVVFALMMAGLITRSSGKEMVNTVRNWAIFAWGTLGLGNLIGMWWSYNELGWGGYWAWDPVENAGLMPWLLGTAFLHSMIMLRQKNYLQKWSLSLVIFTFSLTLLSPFITHGGIESPLHGFYGSPFPPYIMAAILVTIIGSLVALFQNYRYLDKEEAPPSYLSREGAFLLTNIILVVLTIVIFTGTVLPRVIEMFGGTKLVLDRIFFDRICGPLFLVLVLLMGICPLLGWGKAVWHSIKRNFLFTFIAAIIIATVILITRVGNWYAIAAVVCGFPLLTICLEWYRGTISRHRAGKENYLRAFLSLFSRSRARYGGFLTHIGIILITLGIITSSFYSLEKTETLDIGDSINIGSYRLTYMDMVLKQDISKVSALALISVDRNERSLGTMQPSLDFWFSYEDTFSEVAVRSTPAEDLFISLVWTGYDPADMSATFRVLVSPLIVWIWAGGGFLLLGGILAYSSKGQRAAEVTE
ncbi:heme lyase CcmF/NrfE family subunit [Chloroflexota bacterium]